LSTARENILGRVRSSLRRPDGAAPASVPPVLLSAGQLPLEVRIQQFCSALELLAGKTFVARTPEAAGDHIRAIVGDRPVVMTSSPVLARCGISFDSVATPDAAVGITGAEYALANTGTLVVMSESEARLASLLPPVHIAVIESARILSDLDELLLREPKPADRTASMVLITGPSRTADIEQILVRGVHGPGELHVVILM
jgi:L-lactate dehydrogenase complex protein LldG